MEYLNNPVCNSLYIFPLTCSEIETEISRLKTGKSVGPFSIPVDQGRKLGPSERLGRVTFPFGQGKT